MLEGRATGTNWEAAGGRAAGGRQLAAGTQSRTAIMPHPHPTPSQRPTYCPALQNDIKLVYKKIEEGADVNFVFGRAYKCPEGYTPLMVACHRGRCAGRIYTTSTATGSMAPRRCAG